MEIHQHNEISSHTIFLIEDDEVDARAMSRAIARQGVDCAIIRARDGVEALQIIDERPEEIRRSLILVDINMPRMSGIEFIQRLRANNLMAQTPIIILTTSRLREDVKLARKLGVTGYIVKDQFEIELASLLKNFTYAPQG